jgi:hypothetical protein
MKRIVVAASIVAALAAGVALAQDKKPDRETKVRADKENVEKAGAWIYDDLPRGVEEAKKSGKPLLVVFRCIPCEACAKLDEDVVTRDPVVAKLLDQFVCVRIPKANGMDLSIFQFDYDQSWAAFFLEADMTILGRYGTRSSRTDSTSDVSLEGFAKTLQRVIAFHSALAGASSALPSSWELTRKKLEAKRGPAPDVQRPEDYPTLKNKYGPSLDWKGKVVTSCIHCHMVREAERRTFRDTGRPIPEWVVFPYPSPRALGLVMDPKDSTRVLDVTPGSSAAKDGFRTGDLIHSIDGQPTMSIADVQWVLRSAGVAESVTAYVSHDNPEEMKPMKLSLPAGWRTKDDISWRASSWGLRRMTTGGMLLEALPAEERAKLSIKDGAMALVAKYVGQVGDQAAAKNAGFVKGDVVVSVDGRTDVMTETQWLTWLVNAKKPGEKIPVVVLRDGKKLELTLPMQ